MSFLDALSTPGKAARVFLTLCLLLMTGCKYEATFFHRDTEAKSDAKGNSTPIIDGSVTTNAAGFKLANCALGSVWMTNKFETCLPLGKGRNCHLTPVMIDSHTVQLTVTIDAKTANGKIRELSIAEVSAPVGKPVGLAVGDFKFSLTPEVVTQ